MAKAAKKSTKQNIDTTPTPKEQKVTNIEQQPLTTSQKVRIGIGMFFLMIDVFLTFSMIGYIFSWEKDMDKLLSSNSVFQFLFDNEEPVNNFCGRLGAAAAHVLIFQSFGIAAFFLSIWLVGLGWNIINKNTAFTLLKGLKWMAMGFLLFCPLLTFIFPNSSFPIGGALGKWFIDWMGGFAGNAGIIIMLLIVASFFIYVVFEWKLKPIYNKAKSWIPEAPIDNKDSKVADEFKGFQNPIPTDETFHEGVQYTSTGNALKATHDTSLDDTAIINDTDEAEEDGDLLDFGLIE